MITNTYIKQCEMAEEVQRAWRPVEGDRFIYRNDLKQKIIIYRKESDEPAINVLHKIMFYLPTLEQLFEMVKPDYDDDEMVKPDYDDDWKIIICFRNWITNKIINTKNRITFMDYNVKELLLLWIMAVEYNKVWTGEKWVKAE